MAFNFFTFARTRRCEFAQYLEQRRVTRGAHLIKRHRFGTQHAGPAQYVRGGESLHARPGLAQLFAQRAQLLQHFQVEIDRFLRGGQRVKTDPAFDLAAIELAHDLFAQAGFERAQFIRQAELQIEIAVIDGAQLYIERGGRKFARRTGKSGHAVDHFVHRE